MENFEAIGRALMGSVGTDKMKNLAESEEAKAISRIVDATAVEKAAKSGDISALKSIFNQIMSTDEGKRLAAMVSKNVDQNKK